MLAQFFSSLVASPSSRVANNLENPSFNLNSAAAVALLTQGTASSSGITVKHETALTQAAVWQAVSMISGDVASMTLNLYRRLPGDDREIDDVHPAGPMVSVDWNDEVSANEGWRRTVAHALLWGNAYVWIEYEGETPVAMYNMLPDRTKPERMEDGELYYTTEVDGQVVPLMAREVLHIKGLSVASEVGADLVDKARDAIGLALAAEGFSSKFYGQGCTAGGILEIPSTFSDTAANKLEEGFRKRTTGGDNWFKTVVLRDGAKFHQITVDAQKSQTNELRESQVRDIARFFNLPPGKLGVAGSVSYGSFEQSQLEYLSSCLTHWLRAIASACGMKFLTRAERRRTHYFEHNTSNWIEVDTETMTSVLSQQRAAGFINANEARRKLNLPKRTDPDAESYGNPNTTPGVAPEPAPAEPVERQFPQETPQPEPTPSTQNRDTIIARNAFNRDAGRLAKRLAMHARNLAKNGKKFADWLDTKCLDQWPLVPEFLGGVIEDVAEPGAVSQVQAALFGEIVSRFSPFLEPPHKAAALVANVDREATAFEHSIGEKLAGIVFANGVKPSAAESSSAQVVDLEPILTRIGSLEVKVAAPRVTTQEILRDENGYAVRVVKTEGAI